MHNKKAIKKFFAIILMSILMCSFFAVTTFAEETNEVRYATSEDVNLVFGKYVNIYYFTPLSESDTVTKSKLYKTMVDTYNKFASVIPDLKEELPVRILLDLKNHPKDLITEDDLFMYLDEFEKSNDTIRVKFVGDEYFWVSIIIIIFLFGMTCSICTSQTNDIPNYSNIFGEIQKSMRSITDNLSSIKEIIKFKKR